MPTATEASTRGSHIADLAKYGMQRVARMELLNPIAVRTTIEVPEAADWECTIYAIVFNDIIERIGSSKGKLQARCRQTDRYLTNFLNGKCPPQNQRETVIWRECFAQYGIGTLYARVGPMVTTDFGTYNDYLAVENVLLGRYDTRLNNSHHR